MNGNRFRHQAMRGIVNLSILSICLTAGCVRSVQPILKPEQVITDDRFLGDWVTSDGKQTGVVTATDDHKGYKLLYTDEHGKQANLLISLGKVGDLMIAQSTIDDPAPEASGVYHMHLLQLYSFMIVKQVTPQLIINTMDGGWLSKYVKAHPGELSTLPPGDSDVVVTATTEEFQQFLLHHVGDDGALTNDSNLVRPGDPTTQATTAPAAK